MNRQFSIEITPADGLRLRLIEDGDEMGGGGAENTPAGRMFLENQAYAWGATEEVQPEGGADAKSTP